MLIVYYEFTFLERLLRNHIWSIQPKLGKILLYLLGLGAPDQELRQRYSRSFLEVLPDEFNNLAIRDILANVEDLRRGDEHTLDHELHIHEWNILHLIEIEQIEEKTNLVFSFRIWKDDKPREKFKRINKPILVRVKDLEHLLIALKDALKLCQVDSKVITNTFESSMKLSDFSQGQLE